MKKTLSELQSRYFLIGEKLQKWFSLSGRHDLPWRTPATPYRVLVSEFMLQQTTVATISSRFEQWMKLFPDIAQLSYASEAAVLEAWQGLGYYARARRLHQLAKRIMVEYQGEIPADRATLEALPGIGPYTAAALQAFAFDQKILPLDTNIKRVITRLENLSTPIDTQEGQKILEQHAEHLLSPSSTAGGARLAAAFMDLGASICTARSPNCLLCPLEQECLASDPEKLPRQKPRPVITRKKEKRLLIQPAPETILLEYSKGPHWKGLWILPLVETLFPKPPTILQEARTTIPPSPETFSQTASTQATTALLAKSPSKPADWAGPFHSDKISSLIYPITRYRVTMELYRCPCSVAKTLDLDSRLRLFPLSSLTKIAIPSPHRRILKKLFPQNA